MPFDRDDDEYYDDNEYTSAPPPPIRVTAHLKGGQRRTRPLADRFWEKVDRHGPIPENRPELGPCWLWTGKLKHRQGYGIIVRGGGRGEGDLRAHRVSWWVQHGEWPSQQLDHLCRNRACVNPDHLEPVTSRENTLRGAHPNIALHLANRCKRGHLVEGDNAAPQGKGRVRCRICVNAGERARRAQRRQEDKP